jgi:hypothetical protein
MDEYDAYLVHASEDESVAGAIAKGLTAKGLRV